MKPANGVYIPECNIEILTATADKARRLAVRIAAATGISNIYAN